MRHIQDKQQWPCQKDQGDMNTVVMDAMCSGESCGLADRVLSEAGCVHTGGSDSCC